MLLEEKERRRGSEHSKKNPLMLPFLNDSEVWKVVGPVDKCFARVLFPAVSEPWLITQTSVPFWLQYWLMQASKWHFSHQHFKHAVTGSAITGYAVPYEHWTWIPTCLREFLDN